MPRKTSKERKTSQVGVRVRPSLRADLQHAADLGGRSLSQEIVKRLEDSLLDEYRLNTENRVRAASLVLDRFVSMLQPMKGIDHE